MTSPHTLPAPAGPDFPISRSRLIASGAEALNLAVERVLEADGALPFPLLVPKIAAAAEDALVDLGPLDARQALYTFLALRLVRERAMAMQASGGPFGDTESA